MIIGFWNIQRATQLNPRRRQAPAGAPAATGALAGAGASAGAGARAGFVCATLNAWINPSPTNPSAPDPPDVLVLCEAAQSGRELIGAFRRFWPAYDAEYIPVRDRLGGRSPCSFILIAQQGLLTKRPMPTGASTKRPTIILEVGGMLTIAACHVIANRRKAMDEIFTFCVELGAKHHRALVIGDMNIPFREIPQDDREYMDMVGWEDVEPGMTATFRTGTILDYCWRNEGLQLVNPKPPFPNYNRWAIIDHAPIAYEV